MHIFITLIVGVTVGALARLIMPGKHPGGAIVTISLGVAGAFIAGMLGHALGWTVVGQGPGVIASVVGAVLLLALYRAIVGRRAVVGRRARTSW